MPDFNSRFKGFWTDEVDAERRVAQYVFTTYERGVLYTGVLSDFLYSSLGGTPAEVTGSPYASGGLTPISILPAASGGYVYVANETASNGSTGSLAEFAVTATGTAYSLTVLSSTASTGSSPACSKTACSTSRARSSVSAAAGDTI